MGSGKTSVGELVARPLELPLVDVDEAIRARTGHTVKELWEAGGEAAYRALERDVVLEALEPQRPTVLAAPGGVVVDAECVRALNQAHVGVVYLRAEPSVLADRIAADPQPRPLLGADPLRVLEEQHTARDADYAAIAQMVIQIDVLTPEQAAEEILTSGLIAATAARDG
jgi:shikimate kinase